MSYRILPRRETEYDGTYARLTLHYERDGVQKSCVFAAPIAAPIPEDPEQVLKELLEQGKHPSGPITYNAQGGSWG